jgi:hypothetical protein
MQRGAGHTRGLDSLQGGDDPLLQFGEPLGDGSYGLLCAAAVLYRRPISRLAQKLGPARFAFPILGGALRPGAREKN